MKIVKASKILEEFEVLQMKEGESVDAHFARTLTIANKMKIHGENMKQVVIIEKILRSITSRFDYVICSIKESNNLDTLTIDELQSNLLVHEQRLNGRVGYKQALKVHTIIELVEEEVIQLVKLFEEEVEEKEEVDIHSTKLQLSVISVIS